jgi:hypothetical protein
MRREADAQTVVELNRLGSAATWVFIQDSVFQREDDTVFLEPFQ